MAAKKVGRGRPTASQDGKKRRTIALSVDPRLEKILRDLAAEEKRPLAWSLTDLLVEALKARGRRVPRLD